MKLDTRCIIVLALAGTAGPVAAQDAEVTVGAAHVTDASGAARSGLRIAPSLSGSGPRGAWRASASVFVPQGGSAWVTAGADANLTLGAFGPLAATVDGSAALETTGEGRRGSTIRVAPAIGIAGSGWGAAVGPMLGASYTLGPTGRDRWGGLPIGASGGGAVQRSLLAYRAAAWVGTAGSAGTATWSAAEVGRTRWREATLHLRHRAGAVEFGAAGGVRHGALDERWISGGVSLHMREPFTISAELGGHPSDPAGDRPGGRFAALSLSYAPRRASAGPGAGTPPAGHRSPRAVRVSVAAPEGADVSIAGDWNGWRPERLARGPDGRYAAELNLAPGTYRFVVRVDGEARVPDGYPSEPDAYGGRSALLRVSPGS